MQEFIEAVPSPVWWILGVIIAPSLLALISIMAIVAIAIRTTGGSFSLKLPFGAHLEMGVSPAIHARRYDRRKQNNKSTNVD